MRRSLAWFLIVCICVVNLNTFTYAAENALTKAGLHTASNWNLDRTASASDADVIMPEDMLKTEELLKEAERVVTNGYTFDFEKTIKLLNVDIASDEELILDDGTGNKTLQEQYREIFNGYETFALFYDNGKQGRLVSEASDSAYGYILIRLAKEDYESYLSRAGRPESPADIISGMATASNAMVLGGGEDVATASNANADGRKTYIMTGREDLIFLYINGTDMDITFSLNLNEAVAPEITVPSIENVAVDLGTEPDEDDELLDDDVELINDLEDKASPSNISLSRSFRQVPLVSSLNPDEETIDDMILEEETGEDDETYGWNIDDEDIPFEIWQELVGGDEEEDDDDEYYSGNGDEEEDEVKRLNPSFLPMAVGSVVPQKKSFFRSARAAEQQVMLRAAVLSVRSLGTLATGYYKQIEKGTGDEYTLHLGVSGRNQALDVLLIIDRSGSMKESIGDGYNSPSRIDTLKKVLTDNNSGFVDRVMESTGNDSRFAVVTYGDYGKQVLEWSNNAGAIKSAVKNIEIKSGYYGRTVEGTNYEDGLWVGKEVLEKRGESDRVPVVIFLSDGKPSFYNMDSVRDWYYQDDATNGTEFNKKSSEWPSTGRLSEDADVAAKTGVAGSGTDDSGRTGVQARVAGKEFYQYAHNEVGANIFSVGFGQDFRKTYLNYIARGEDDNTEHPNVIAGNDLTDAFTSILDSLVFKNVKIKDTLSAYVDLADKKTVGTVWKIVDGEKQPLAQGRDYKSLSYVEDSRQVILEFGEDRKLDEDAVYELEFKIKTNDAARSQVAQHGHTDTGEPDTDYGDNSTSAGKAGLFSNKEAVISYGAKDTMSITYPKPVVQVDVDPVSNRKYIKDNKDGTYDLTLDVTAKVGGTAGSTKEYPLDLVFVLDKSTSMSKDIAGNTRPNNADKRVTKVNAAVESLIKTISDKLGSERFQYNAVHFSGTAKVDYPPPSYSPNWTYGEDFDVVYQDQNWSGTYSNRVKVNAPPWPSYGSPTDSTVPNPAIQEAIKILNQGSSVNQNKEGLKKAIIFLTDGNPSDEKGEINRVANAVKAIDPSTMFYSIGYSSDTGEGYLTALDSALKGRGVSSQKWSARDNTALESIFNDITKALTSTSSATPGVTNVTISDTLSDYAELVSTAPESIQVIVDGQVLTASEEREYGIRKQITGKKVTVSFPNEMSQGSTYAIAFKVKPSSEAMKYYADQGGAYPHIGDPDTDVPGMQEAEWTSSGKEGFASNEEAEVTYIYNSGNSSETYPVPVLQVKQGSLRIKKVVDGNEAEARTEDFIIHIKKDGEEYADLVLKGDGEASGVIHVYREETFTISESVPKEYELLGFTAENADKSEVPDGKFEGGDTAKITVGPGDDIVVTVRNKFAHTPYFHADAAVTNTTTGEMNQPFTNGQDEAKKLALSQETAMLMDNGPKEMILEESDRLV